jgi:hypothetical protein
MRIARVAAAKRMILVMMTPFDVILEPYILSSKEAGLQ